VYALPEKPNTFNPFKKRQEVLETMRGTGTPRGIMVTFLLK
jgi:hypothetical protein